LIINALFNALYFRNERAEQLWLVFCWVVVVFTDVTTHNIASSESIILFIPYPGAAQ